MFVEKGIDRLNLLKFTGNAGLMTSRAQAKLYRFTTYQDARLVRLVDGLIFETNILRVSPVKPS